MKKVLITGLGLIDAFEGSCQMCNYDYEWIFNHPSILLWADKIILTPSIKATIKEGTLPDTQSPLPKAIKMLFDILEDNDLTEVREMTDVLTKRGMDQIAKQVEKDRELLSKEFPSIVKLGDENKVPGEFFINKDHYCSSSILSIYLGLLLSRSWDASCLFGETNYQYIKYRLGLKSIPKRTSKGYLESFDEILQTYLPNLPLIPHYAHSQQCKLCEHEKKCSDTYLNDLEKNTFQMLKWREYDEIQQLNCIIQNIIDKFHSADQIDPLEVNREFRAKFLKLNKLVSKTFPKIKRWSNLVTCVSIPFAVAGLSANNSLLGLTSAAFAGSSKIATELLGWMENKHRWLGFINKDKIAK